MVGLRDQCTIRASLHHWNCIYFCCVLLPYTPTPTPPLLLRHALIFLRSSTHSSALVTWKIAKTGSLCCVAARPHGSHATTGDWSVGPHDTYWRTNTSFSPTPSSFNFQFCSDGLPNALQDSEQLYGSSSSSTSKGSRRWVNDNHLDIVELLVSSSSDLSQGPQWTPPAIQEINFEDHETSVKRDLVLQRLSTPTVAGTSANQDSLGSYSSHSESSESESALMSCMGHRNIPNRRFFVSKPVHPLSFPIFSPTREVSSSGAAGTSELEASINQREAPIRSNGCSNVDFTDSSEPLESEVYGQSFISSDAFRCGLCERFLSQRSPWSSRRIIRSGDMPVAGVLSCRHVFHAECLEQTTPKARKNDPPCPLCFRVEEGIPQEFQVFSKVKSGPPRLRNFPEDATTRTWGCAHVGDCVEGALHASPRNAMMLLNRSRVKRNLSLKGANSKEFLGKSKKSGVYSAEMGRSMDRYHSIVTSSSSAHAQS